MEPSWYRDQALVSAMPLRYRGYALYSRLAGTKGSRSVCGGSFLLRALRVLSNWIGLSTVVPIRGRDHLTVLVNMGDERVLDVIHEIRGENPEYEVMRALLTDGDTFVDAGANFGTFSLLASRLVGDRGKVIALEPQPVLAALVRKSLDLSGAKNCKLLEIACSSEPGEMALIVPANDSGRAGFFGGFSRRPGSSITKVRVKTLDDVLSETDCPGRMLIKIDVEGSEAHILSGARKTIAERKPAILIELNPWSAAAAETSTSAIVGRLGELGYRSFSLAESFPKPVAIGDIPHDRQVNLVATQ